MTALFVLESKFFIILYEVKFRLSLLESRWWRSDLNDGCTIMRGIGRTDGQNHLLWVEISNTREYRMRGGKFKGALGYFIQELVGAWNVLSGE